MKTINQEMAERLTTMLAAIEPDLLKISEQIEHQLTPKIPLSSEDNDVYGAGWECGQVVELLNDAVCLLNGVVNGYVPKACEPYSVAPGNEITKQEMIDKLKTMLAYVEPELIEISNQIEDFVSDNYESYDEDSINYIDSAGRDCIEALGYLENSVFLLQGVPNPSRGPGEGVPYVISV